LTTDKKHIAKDKGAQLKAISWVAAAFFLVGIAVISGLYFEQNTEIRGIEFKGNHYTSTDDLLKSIESPVGLMADSVNYSALFNSIKTLPYVKDVSVSMSIRGTLSFNVSEHEPLALLVDGSDRVYVTESGIKLPLVHGKGNDVPLVYGFSVMPVSDTLSNNAYSNVEQFLLDAKENRFGWLTISEVAWNEREGVVALSHENGVKLIFGHENYKERLIFWENFYSEVVARKGIRSFQSVDLRFRNQIVTYES
jgi:cell division protein FtsQ